MPRRGLEGLQRREPFRLVAFCLTDIQTRGISTRRAHRLALWNIASSYDLAQLTVVVHVSVERCRACYLQFVGHYVIFVFLLPHLDVL